MGCRELKSALSQEPVWPAFENNEDHGLTYPSLHEEILWMSYRGEKHRRLKSSDRHSISKDMKSLFEYLWNYIDFQNDNYNTYDNNDNNMNDNKE